MRIRRIVTGAGTFSDVAVETETAAGRALVRMAALDTPGQVEAETADADAVLVTTQRVTAAHIDAMGPSVRVIGRIGIGLDAIDLAAAAEAGLTVVHTPDYATAEVATHAIAMALAVHRKLVAADALSRTNWRGWRGLDPIPALEDCFVGVLGCGHIGRAVLDRFRPFTPGLLSHDPFGPAPPDGVQGVSFQDLLRRSDIISLHLPLTDETRGIIGAPELALMRPTAILVNVARGGLVDEAALADALTGGGLGGAALDVLADEPPVATTRLLSTPHTLLSPHVAWYSSASERRVRAQCVNAVLAFLDGSPLPAGRVAVAPRTPRAQDGTGGTGAGELT